MILCFRHGSPAYYADCWAPIYTGLHQLPTYRDDPLPSKLRPEGNTEAADQQPLLGRRGEYIHSRLLICVYIKWFIQFSSFQFYSHNPKSQQQSHQGNPTVVQRKSHLEINVIENDKRFFNFSSGKSSAFNWNKPTQEGHWCWRSSTYYSHVCCHGSRTRWAIQANNWTISPLFMIHLYLYRACLQGAMSNIVDIFSVSQSRKC